MRCPKREGNFLELPVCAAQLKTASVPIPRDSIPFLFRKRIKSPRPSNDGAHVLGGLFGGASAGDKAIFENMRLSSARLWE